jgi:hypothetical protein
MVSMQGSKLLVNMLNHCRYKGICSSTSLHAVQGLTVVREFFAAAPQVGAPKHVPAQPQQQCSAGCQRARSSAARHGAQQ